MTVNAYVAWDSASRQAAVFDTGADASPILDCLREHQLTVAAIFITHAHGDHIFDLDRLVEKTGAPSWIGSREPFEASKPWPKRFEAGQSFTIGSLTIQTRLTRGHAEGGVTYVLSGLERPVAFVGDAVFAGSMGGGKVSYTDALETNRTQILSLPENTVLCPGHGPMTTVGEERHHNPFFPEFQHEASNKP
jgi:glyoxylase-like metal-dependent hydrolase (beta-lactamase superfamily II)